MRNYGRGRRVCPARFALAGGVILIAGIIAIVAVLVSAKSPSHPVAGKPPVSASASQAAGAPPSAPVQLISCSKAKPGTPQYVACLVTSNCFKLCGSADPSTFLTSVRGLMETQPAADLLDQASFASKQTLTSSAATSVSACVGECSLQVQILSAALEGPNSPATKGSIQYVLTQTGGHWLVKSYIWRAGDGP
jgi:hypothetical protein